jgi:integrase
MPDVTIAKPRGRPRRHSEFDTFYASLPRGMSKRPKYLKGIGIFRGQRGDTAWVKVLLRHPTQFDGKSYAAGQSLEMKLGRLNSFDWEALIRQHDELQGKADRGEPLEQVAPQTFEAHAANWLERAKVRLRGPETAAIHLRKHLNPAFGGLALSSISPQIINEWVSRRLSAEAKASTVKREIATLSAILADAARQQIIVTNPCDSLERLPPSPPRQRFLSPEELRIVARAANTQNLVFGHLVCWLACTGMRRGEALKLKRDSIRNVGGGTKVLYLETTKSGRPRLVPVTPMMERILAALNQQEDQPNDRIFQISIATIKRQLLRLRAQTGLTDITLHDLRRTYATHAINSGINARTVSELLGHADLAMLQSTYSVVSEGTQRTAALEIEASLSRMIETIGAE